MHAQSLVGSVRTLDRRADRLLDQPSLEPPWLRRVGLAQLSTLGTIDTLVNVGLPLPVTELSTHPADDLLESLLDILYEDGAIELSLLDRRMRERASDTERVTVVGPYLLVPLEDGYNRQQVFAHLIDRFEGTTSKCERVLARAETMSAAPVARRTWQSTVETIAETRALLETQLARQERLRRLYTRPADGPVEFADWTLDQLTDVRTEP